MPRSSSPGVVSSGTIPPLLGDAQGRYRVHVVGNSGSGKTTTGEALATILGVPFVPMDAFFHEPGWATADRATFKARLRAALDADPRGWVADGNYVQAGGDMAFMEATDVIWLDPPLYVYFPRLVWRTLLRVLRLAPPCSPECFERAAQVFFSRNSVLLWCLSTHRSVRERNAERMRLVGVESGSDVAGRKMRRFGGWGGDVRAWLREVAAMVGAKKD